MNNKGENANVLTLLESLLQDGSFDISEQSFYYADTKDNYDNNIIKNKCNMFDSYNSFTEEAEKINGGVVKINISKDTKTYTLNNSDNLEEAIKKAKTDGYDLAVVNNGSKYEYIILNESIITNKSFLSVEEAKKECYELENKYNEMQKKLQELLNQEEKSNDKKHKKNNGYSKEQKDNINKLLKEYGFIDENDYIDDSGKLSKLLNQYNKLKTEFKVDIASLELAIGRLESVNVDNLYESLSNANNAIVGLGLELSNKDSVNKTLQYVQTNIKSGENKGDKAKSYLNKLSQLKKTLVLNNPNYEISKHTSMLSRIDDFAADLDLSDIEKNAMVQQSGKALMALVQPQIDKMNEMLAQGNITEGPTFKLENEEFYNYLNELYKYANNMSIYYDNDTLNKVMKKRIDGTVLSDEEKSFLFEEHPEETFDLLAKIQYLNQNASDTEAQVQVYFDSKNELSTEEQRWYDSIKNSSTTFTNIDNNYKDIAITNMRNILMQGKKLNIAEQMFMDQNAEGYDERCKERKENGDAAFEKFVKDVNSGKLSNVTVSKVYGDDKCYTRYVNAEGKFVTKKEYDDEVARITKINEKAIKESAELSSPTIKEVKITSSFDMLSELDQYILFGNAQYKMYYCNNLAVDMGKLQEEISKINSKVEEWNRDFSSYTDDGKDYISTKKYYQELARLNEEKELFESKVNNINKEYLSESSYWGDILNDAQKGMLLKKPVALWTVEDYDFINYSYPAWKIEKENNLIELEQIEIAEQREEISTRVIFNNIGQAFVNTVASIGNHIESVHALSDRIFFNKLYHEKTLSGGYSKSKSWAQEIENNNETLSKERKLSQRNLELTRRKNSNDQALIVLKTKLHDFEELSNKSNIKAYDVYNELSDFDAVPYKIYTFYADEAKTQKITVTAEEAAIFLAGEGVDKIDKNSYIVVDGKQEKFGKKINTLLESFNSFDNSKLIAKIMNYDINKNLESNNWNDNDFKQYVKQTLDVGYRLGGMEIAEEWASSNSVIGRSLLNGLTQWWHGMENLFSADGIVNSNDYACMYYTQILSSDYSTVDAMANEVVTSIGNMLPSISMQLAATALAYFCPPAGAVAIALLENASAISMGLSATGNAREQALQQGFGASEAWVYAIMTGASEALLEKVLGGIKGISMSPNLQARLLSGTLGKLLDTGFGTFVHEMFSEGLEESIQEILEPLFKGLATGNYEAVDWNAVIKSGLYGAMTAGIMNAASGSISSSIGAISYLTTGSSVGLITILGKYKNGKIIEDFDSFKADFNALSESRKNGTLAETVTKLSKDSQIQAQYDAYVEEYKKLKQDSKMEETIGEMQTKKQFVEAIAIEAITNSKNADLYLKSIARDINIKTQELESINKLIENEKNGKNKQQLKKKAESIQNEIDILNANNKKLNTIKLLASDYYNAALISSNPLMNFLTEIIRAEQETNEEVDEKKTGYKIDDNGEIVRDGTSGEIIEDLRGEDIPIFTPPADTETDTIVEVEKVKDFYEKNKNIFDKFSNNKEKREIIRKIYSLLEYDSTLQLSSSMELNTENGKSIYRGISAKNVEELTNYINQFINGEVFYGGRASLYGTGIYTYNGESVGRAADYASDGGTNNCGIVLEMKLSDDSKVINSSELESIRNSIIEKFNADSSTEMESFLSLLNDDGVLASLLGYDAINVEEKKYVVVLNRSKIILDDTNISEKLNELRKAEIIEKVDKETIATKDIIDFINLSLTIEEANTFIRKLDVKTIETFIDSLNTDKLKYLIKTGYLSGLESIYEYKFYSEKVADFYKKNGIVPSEVREKVDTKVYKPTKISEIIDYYGKYKYAKTKTVSVGDIVGSSNLKSSVSDIYEVLGEFFGGKIANSYDTRSDSNLTKSVDEMLSSNSFVREPMRMQNMSTDPNNPIYVISSNGMHRFVSLRALYLNELSNNLENATQLNNKYSVQAEVTELDATKTFAHYILSKFSNITDLSIEYVRDSDGNIIGLSDNSKIYVNGQEIEVSDAELINMVKDVIEKNKDTLLNYDIYKNEKEYIKFIHDLGYKMSNEIATLEEKQNILINSTKNSFESFLKNDNNGKVLSLFDEEGCKLLEKSGLLYDRLGYVFAFSNHINELIKNEKFIELTVKSLSYLKFNNLSIESKNYLLNKCIEMKMGNDTFVQIFNEFDTNFQLELLDNWKYSEELKCCIFDGSSIGVMNKMLQEHSVDILSENINIVRMFEKAKRKIDIPADYITKELAQKIIEECKGNIFEIRNAINNASYSTDTTILEEYLRNYEKNIILSIQNNSLISEYNEVFEAFKKFKSFEEDNTEWYDAWRTYLRILRKSPLAEERQIFNIENSVDEVFETIKKANDEYVCNLIIDSTFGDNYYNIALNLGELLNFYYEGHIKLSQDKVSLYTKVLNMDTLSSNELIELYNQLNEVSIQEMFYNDISNARLIMREKIKEKSLDFSEMQKYKDEELSKKYGVDVYKIDHDNFYAIVKTGRHASDSMPTGHSYSLIGNGKFDVHGNVEDANTFVYDASGLNPDQIVHVYPRDSFTFYRPFENSTEATDRINNLLMPEDLLGNTLGYNELLILEQGSNATGLDEDIKELKKMALYCVDDISQQAVDVAKSQGVGIFFVDTKTYDAQIEQSNDTYHSELNYWDYTYYNKNDLPKIKQEIVKIKEKINSMSKNVKFNLENKLKEKFGEFRDYIYGIKTLNAEEAAQYFDLDYSEYLFNNYKIDPFNPETEIRNILQHIDFSKIFSSFDSGVSKIQDYLLRFMINNNVLNINSLTKNMSVELAINYFGNIYLENEKIKFTDILNCLPSDAILPFVVKFKNNLSDKEICNFIRQIHDSSYSAFSYESQHQVIFDDELVKKLFEIDVIHDYLIRRIGSRYFYGLVESYNLPSELLIQRELLLKSVLNNADSYSFSEIRETIADLYFHNGVLPVKLDLETILFMANKDITFRNEILGDDYLYLSKLYNYFTNDIDFRNLDLDLSKGKEMIEKYFSQCQDRFKDLMVEKIEQNPTENLTPEILVSSNGKNVRVYSLENQTETQKHFTFLVSTINPNSEYIKAQDAIDFKEKYYSSQNIEAFKGYRSCSLINEQSLEYIFSPYRGIVFGYTNLDGRNIISANYGDARTDNPNFVKYGRVNKSNFDTIESFIEHTQRWNEITVSKAENINAMQPSYIYVTSAPTQFQIDVAAEFGIPIIYVNKESYMQQKMLPRENASYYGWGEDFIKTTKIENDLLTNIQPKVSVEDFRNRKSDLSELIDEVAKYDSIEEMFKSDEMKKIKKITDLLLSSDLSSIPSSEWGKIYLIPSNATDIENIHLDFSKTHANIDFSNFNSMFKTADFRGCNIESLENISSSGVIACVFDSSVMESHRDIFLSDLFDSSFKEKFYKGYLQISDLVELSEAQLDELQKNKYLSDHFPYYKNNAEGKISLKQAVEIFKKYGNEIADKLMYNDFLIKDLLNKNYHPFFEEYSSYITRYGKLFQFAERYGYQKFWQFVENNIDIISGMDSDNRVQLDDLNPIFTDDIESSFEATFKKLLLDKDWIELPEYAIKRGYHIEFYKDYHQFLDSDSKTIFRPIVYQDSLINLNEIDKNLIIDIINHYKDMDPNYDKIDFGIFIENPYILHYFVEKNTFKERYDFLSDSAALFYYQRCKGNPILGLENYIKSHVGTKPLSIAEFQEYAKEYNKEEASHSLRPILSFFDTGDDEYVDHIKKNLEKLLEVRPGLDVYSNPCLCTAILEDSFIDKYGFKTISDLLEYNTSAYKILIDKEKSHDTLVKKWIDYLNSLPNYNIKMLHYGLIGYDSTRNLINSIDESNIILDNNQLFTLFQILKRENPFKVESIYQLDHYFQHRNEVLKDMINSEEIADVKNGISQALFATSFGDSEFLRKAGLDSEEYVKYLYESEIIDGVDLTCIELINQLAQEKDISRLKFVYNELCDQGIIFDFDQLENKLKKYYSKQIKDSLFKDPVVDSEGIEHYYINGVDDTSIKNKDGEPMSSTDKIPVVKLKGIKFKLLIHTLMSGNDPNFVSYRDKLIKDPSLWNKLDGASTISTSLISERSNWLGSGDISYGFSEISENSLVSMGPDDIFLSHGYGVLDPRGQRDVEYSTPDVLISRTTKGNYLNEVGLYRKSSDSNEYDHRLQPTCIVCSDYSINTESIRAAQYFKIPIYVIDGAYYSDYDNKIYEQYNSLGKTINDISDIENIMYSKKPIKDKCNLVIKLLDEGKANKSITSQKYVELLTECRKIVCMYPIGNDRVLVSELDNKISTAKRDLNQ